MERTYTLQNIDNVAEELLASLSSKTLLFYGAMGTGKTTLIKSLIKTLGSEDTVSSPTFSLVNEYHTPESKIYHFDLYRIESSEELYDFGIEDYLHADCYKFIEWPERLEEIVIDDVNFLTIKMLENGARHLKLKENNRLTPNLPMYTQHLL
ncbi:tRNA (adenosine(37)-N6)-threonylcarbamoyltransferase complex ATPase subunit type 1 TsaE [Ichthyenterobacterium sp. W332]|uniref:tRNA threonylcarbamoyladenosine biosynthesis protein TsaE n=1 Tax=Microcosmobacter mediterraneus TaxID=3075607 RepID=A0ABU2YN15_9FLAO|nr:tRNA (adenosine(37)-N6)-threonylcarbamoyltransferase complex ATPase subunit type 1 TsaE [Ichthyenterobacterium sp. W332]MDT0558670.1 tRNA (adenosine(37)-N6)-threonylcarbamoyltransferase complex ATPase subunit type 1 TsaE [Ichthyenterobacterium sp. W332]